MASEVLPAFLTDLPGDIAELFNDLAFQQEDFGGRSALSVFCGGATHRATAPNAWWQDHRVVERHRLPSHTPLRACESLRHALSRSLSDPMPTGQWVLPLTDGSNVHRACVPAV